MNRRVVVLLAAVGAVYAFLPGVGHAEQLKGCTEVAKFFQNKIPTYNPGQPFQIGENPDPLSNIRQSCVSGDLTPTADVAVVLSISGTQDFNGEIEAIINGALGMTGRASGIFINGSFIGPIPGKANSPNAVLKAGSTYKITATAHGFGRFFASIDVAPSAPEPSPSP
jgi:hypothetical protein